jgi:hypothetical protein
VLQTQRLGQRTRGSASNPGSKRQLGDASADRAIQVMMDEIFNICEAEAADIVALFSIACFIHG